MCRTPSPSRSAQCRHRRPSMVGTGVWFHAEGGQNFALAAIPTRAQTRMSASTMTQKAQEGLQKLRPARCQRQKARRRHGRSPLLTTAIETPTRPVVSSLQCHCAIAFQNGHRLARGNTGGRPVRCALVIPMSCAGHTIAPATPCEQVKPFVEGDKGARCVRGTSLRATGKRAASLAALFFCRRVAPRQKTAPWWVAHRAPRTAWERVGGLKSANAA